MTDPSLTGGWLWRGVRFGLGEPAPAAWEPIPDDRLERFSEAKPRS